MNTPISLLSLLASLFLSEQEYVDGFGTLGKNFWMGLSNLYLLTNSKNYDLHLLFSLPDKTRYYMIYSDFRLTENVTYTMSLGPRTKGGLSDHLQDMDGQRFSTADNDNDNSTARNCAQEYGGGWWFNACADYNFNGVMTDTGVWAGDVAEVFYQGLGNVTPTTLTLRLLAP